MIKVSSERFTEALEAGVFKDKDFEGEYLIPECVTLQKGVRYGNVNGRELLLDIFYREEQPLHLRPTIVFIHGGGFIGGSPEKFYPQAAYFAMKYNMLAVSISYRFGQEAHFPAAVQDCKCAVRWIRSVAQKYNVDTERIAVAGGSAGGNLAAMIAVTKGMQEFEGNGGHQDFPSDANLAIAFNGVFEFYERAKNFRDADRAIKIRNQQYIGGSVDDMGEQYKKASPIYFINKDMSPMLFLHGSKDSTVSCKQSIEMFTKYWEVGVKAEIEIFEGVGHGWFNKAPHFMPVLRRAEDFIVKHFQL